MICKVDHGGGGALREVLEVHLCMYVCVCLYLLREVLKVERRKAAAQCRVCIYIYIYIYVCILLHHMYMYRYICTYIYIYTYIYILYI